MTEGRVRFRFRPQKAVRYSGPSGISYLIAYDYASGHRGRHTVLAFDGTVPYVAGLEIPMRCVRRVIARLEAAAKQQGMMAALRTLQPSDRREAAR